MPWHVDDNHEGCDGFAVVKDATGEVEGCHDTRESANRQMAALYANEPAARSSDLSRAPVEFRAASVADVNYAQRIISLIAVPYNQQAVVEWRGQLWQESFARGSFDGIEKRPGRVKANRDHDRHRLVGKAVKFWPSREEGLVAEVKISPTPLGEETLALADDDVLGASVEFAARLRDQILDKRAMTRRHTRAYIEQIALVPDPAYEGATVQSVRSSLAQSPDAAMKPLVTTPILDEFLADDVLRWARERSQS